MGNETAPRRPARRLWLLKAGKPDRVGRVQRQIRRALLAADGRPVSIGELLPRCYPRSTKYTRWQRWSIHRALPRFAVPLGRYMSAQGRPMLWRAAD